MNDFDKAGRYLVKCDSAGFLRWLFGRDDFEFLDWVDARRVALPDQGDLTNDLAAAVRAAGVVEAHLVELSAQGRPRVLVRALEYVARVMSERRGRDAYPVRSVHAAVVNLTGTSPAQVVRRSRLVSACGLRFRVLRRNLRDEPAAGLVAAVAAGSVSWWQLGWVPLMHGGGEPGTIGAWRRAASARRAETDRGLLKTLTLTFADLGKCRPAWDYGLRGWGVETSSYLNQFRAEGRAQGLTEGRAEGLRQAVLRIGQAKFGRTPTRQQLRQLQAVTDPARLEAMTDRLMAASSWADLLATP